MRLKQLEFNPDDSAVPAAKLTGAILPLLPNRSASYAFSILTRWNSTHAPCRSEVASFTTPPRTPR
jgi:hypothetical protein